MRTAKQCLVMSNVTLGGHVFALLLALLQCCLAVVLAYRLFLLSRTYKGLDPHRRPTTVNMLKVLRVCIFIMTALQCVRCIDPFCALGIWPYALTRFLQLAVTITIYCQYSATTYICMDTLYACALKRTPSWLAIVVSILPAFQFVFGFGALIGEYLIGQQWVTAIVNFYIVLSLAVNLTTYDVSGIWLIRILRSHQQTGTPAAEDISASKSASPFDVVIDKTLRSMFLLSLPSVAALIIYLIIGVNNSNTRPIPPYNPEALGWNVFVTIFAQLVLGLLFTRATWISKTALDAEIMAKTTSTLSNAGSRESADLKRTASRVELKERMSRLSPPKSPRSEGLPSTQSESEAPVVAVTVVDDERSDVLPAGEIV
jgi:hypothetical protein